jgi:hypothetical protein
MKNMSFYTIPRIAFKEENGWTIVVPCAEPTEPTVEPRPIRCLAALPKPVADCQPAV